MNKGLFGSMQKQMIPSPEVRASLSEKLAQPVKKRPVPWRKCGAAAACAALVIGAFSVHSWYKNHEWAAIVSSFKKDAIIRNLHSYVTVEGLSGSVTENTVAANDIGGGTETGAGPNTGVLPGGAYIGDAPSQEEAIQAYDKLVPHVASHPDWYGGAYIDGSGTLVVCLVESKDPGDKTLELQVLDWTDNGRVAFTSGKYSLGYLLDLQTTVCSALYEMGLDFGCGADEELNRLNLTLPSVTEEALTFLASLDPDDDAIYVQVGQFAATNDLAVEDPAVRHTVPGGVVPPVPEDDADLIADEPWADNLDGIHYASEDGAAARRDILEPPEQKKPATVQSSSPERPVHGDTSSFTPAYDPDVGFIYPAQ